MYLVNPCSCWNVVNSSSETPCTLCPPDTFHDSGCLRTRQMALFPKVVGARKPYFSGDPRSPHICISISSSHFAFRFSRAASRSFVLSLVMHSCSFCIIPSEEYCFITHSYIIRLCLSLCLLSNKPCPNIPFGGLSKKRRLWRSLHSIRGWVNPTLTVSASFTQPLIQKYARQSTCN